MCRRYPGYCFPMLGLHPEDIEEDYRQVLANMKAMLEAPDHPYVAIGEVGLDYYWDKSKIKEQEETFRTQIEWAIEYHLPLMIHSRSAHNQLVAAIKEYKGEALSGVFHCFSGSKEVAQELLQFSDFMLGIGGVVTYKNSHLVETLSTVPLERIVLETDAPYLAPIPYRGKRNESSYVVEVLRKIALIYNVSEQQVTDITNSNAKRVFQRINLQ